MLDLKQVIQETSIIARKAKYHNAISALNSLKTAITEAEKCGGAGELTNDEIIKIVNKLVKQREDSYDAFVKGGKMEKAYDEKEQKIVLSKFLPKQMENDEIVSECKIILEEFNLDSTVNKNVVIGKTIGAFNKKFVGVADPKLVRCIIEGLL